jgi:hypothetical protein
MTSHEDVTQPRAPDARTATALPNMEATALALACSLPGDELQQRAVDSSTLFASAGARRALPDGAELEFTGDDRTAHGVLHFALAERRCCKELIFEIAFVPDHSTVRLRIRGTGPQVDGIRAWTETAAQHQG